MENPDAVVPTCDPCRAGNTRINTTPNGVAFWEGTP
jgi:hypothetical protein